MSGLSMRFIRLWKDLVSTGKSIIMVSSDMLELLSMSDRILVLHDGKSSGVLSRADASQENVLRMATGENLADVLKKSSAR